MAQGSNRIFTTREVIIEPFWEIEYLFFFLSSQVFTIDITVELQWTRSDFTLSLFVGIVAKEQGSCKYLTEHTP